MHVVCTIFGKKNEINHSEVIGIRRCGIDDTNRMRTIDSACWSHLVSTERIIFPAHDSLCVCVFFCRRLFASANWFRAKCRHYDHSIRMRHENKRRTYNRLHFRWRDAHKTSRRRIVLTLHWVLGSFCQRFFLPFFFFSLCTFLLYLFFFSVTSAKREYNLFTRIAFVPNFSCAQRARDVDDEEFRFVHTLNAVRGAAPKSAKNFYITFSLYRFVSNHRRRFTKREREMLPRFT